MNDTNFKCKVTPSNVARSLATRIFHRHCTSQDAYSVVRDFFVNAPMIIDEYINVHMNSLPVELKAVVISCLKLARKEIDLKDFKHEVANFAALVESMK